MTAFSNIPPQAVLPLGAYRLEELEREATRADQRCLRADCGTASDKESVLAAIGRGFELPPHYGVNLDALYDCLTDMKPLEDAVQPGFLVILKNLPQSRRFGAEERAALLDVFRDAAEYFFDRDTAFRVFYSIRKPG
jgi:RNAse (barnase) inhibitor barstar